MLGQLGSVEFVHPDLLVVLAGKEMAAMRKYNLSALFNWQLLVSLQLLVKNVHQSDAVAEADDEVKSRRMEGDRVCLSFQD